ncbi:hypothetical protein QEN19_003432 [Hanseniaspora menglaensis]
MSNMSEVPKIKIEEVQEKSFISGQKVIPAKAANKVLKPFNKKTAGHRPVTSCTHCRQHKIKCNALETLPKRCARCLKMDLVCEVDPEFKPQKGSQLTILKNDINDLKLKLNYLVRNEGIIANCLKLSKEGERLMKDINEVKYETIKTTNVDTLLTPTSNATQRQHEELIINSKFNDLPSLLQKTLASSSKYIIKENLSDNNNPSSATSPDNVSHNAGSSNLVSLISRLQSTSDSPSTSSTSSNANRTFKIGDIVLSQLQAEQLYTNFKLKYLSLFPIMKPSENVTELYQQSPILFWTIMLTSSLSSPTPTLYIELSKLIKIKIIQKCWLDTPRSAHIIQALLILCCWPLPSQKIMDDSTYRFLGFAKNLSMQLGLHRGAFMWEFSRTQTMLSKTEDTLKSSVSPGESSKLEKQNDNETWRSRTWIGMFIQEQIWSNILGLPSGTGVDFLVNSAINEDDDKEDSLPSHMKNLLLLTNFQNQMQNQLAMNVNSQDGLFEIEERYSKIEFLNAQLDALNESRCFEKDTIIEIYHLYVKMTLLFYYFLPSVPEKDINLNVDLLKEKVNEAYLAGVKVVTLTTKLLQDYNYQLLELPIYVRNCITFASLMLFKLYLTPLLKEEHITSCRQSIVTVHRLFRNQYFAWTSVVENDISRLGNVLERLNFVLITHPEIFMERLNDKSTCFGLITKMRSHLSVTLFYDLVWCVHEARRRENDPVWKLNKQSVNLRSDIAERRSRKLIPLPFYNQISKDDFETVTMTTENGITVTTLVPTKQAILRAKKQFNTISAQQQAKQKQILKEYGVSNDDEDNFSNDASSSANNLNDSDANYNGKHNVKENTQIIEFKPLFNKNLPSLKSMTKKGDEKSSLRYNVTQNQTTSDRIKSEKSNDMLIINGIPLSMLNETGGLSTKDHSSNDLFNFKAKKNGESQTSLFKNFAYQSAGERSNLPVNFFSERAGSEGEIKANTINDSRLKSPTVSMMNLGKYVAMSPIMQEQHNLVNLEAHSSGVAGTVSSNRGDVFDRPNSLRANSNASLPVDSPRSLSNQLPSLKNVMNDINNISSKDKNISSKHNKNDLDLFLLQQSNDWIMDNTNNNADDILGWFDSNMNNEF